MREAVEQILAAEELMPWEALEPAWGSMRYDWVRTVQAAAPVCIGPGSHMVEQVANFGPLGDVIEPVKYHRLPTTVLRL